MVSLLDYTIIGTYFLLILLVGFFLGRKESLEDYLVNSRRTNPYLLIFTIISTNVGMGSFLGLSSSAYQKGIYSYACEYGGLA
ncbi:MAG: hypothetical protein NC822_02700 [Candidatus Omnitrophica bacterium]|nr:hypothetical protein [Candidatus Omnitrophota bacterium]MCM8826432.1 hypothetical protein [Candidatus Omnitrophota bacterium]